MVTRADEVGRKSAIPGSVAPPSSGSRRWPRWTLIRTLIDPASCVSFVSWWYWVYAAETHETVHWASGMRYHPFPLHLVVPPRSKHQMLYISVALAGTAHRGEPLREPLSCSCAGFARSRSEHAVRTAFPGGPAHASLRATSDHCHVRWNAAPAHTAHAARAGHGDPPSIGAKQAAEREARERQEDRDWPRSYGPEAPRVR